jgi:D-sedoheptulose 7-phosphate isomerase
MYQKIQHASEMMAKSIRNGKKIISCGNGGSHCDALHFAEEMTGKFRNNRPSLPALAISDPSHITCTGNDFGFAMVFARYIEGLGCEGDILLAISTSGNSENILRAVDAAHQKGMLVIALTGNEGGQLSEMADVSLIVPHSGYADRIQEIHIKIIHIFIYLIEKMLI